MYYYPSIYLKSVYIINVFPCEMYSVNLPIVLISFTSIMYYAIFRAHEEKEIENAFLSYV